LIKKTADRRDMLHDPKTKWLDSVAIRKMHEDYVQAKYKSSFICQMAALA